MSDRKALAREIAARTKPRFIQIPKEPKTKLRPDLPRDLKVRARAIAKAAPPRFIDGERERYDGTRCVPSVAASLLTNIGGYSSRSRDANSTVRLQLTLRLCETPG